MHFTFSFLRPQICKHLSMCLILSLIWYRMGKQWTALKRHQCSTEIFYSCFSRLQLIVLIPIWTVSSHLKYTRETLKLLFRLLLVWWIFSGFGNFFQTTQWFNCSSFSSSLATKPEPSHIKGNENRLDWFTVKIFIFNISVSIVGH